MILLGVPLALLFAIVVGVFLAARGRTPMQVKSPVLIAMGVGMLTGLVGPVIFYGVTLLF